MRVILLSIFIPALLLAVYVAVYYHIRVQILRKKLKDSLRSSAEIGSFMNLFSRNIRDVRDAANWMNVTARYVADTIHAVTVCIFTKQGDTLQLSGSSGTVPRVLRGLQIRMLKQKSMSELFSENGSNEDDADMTLLETVAQLRETLLINDPKDKRLLELDPYQQINTIMAVPMIEDGALLGILCAVNRRQKDQEAVPQTEPEKFDRELFGRFKFLAGQVVLAVNIMKVYSNLSEQQRINQELQFARGLQRSLLPRSIPVWGDFTIHAYTRASKEVSGDFYDFVEIDEDRLLVVIGDACGKGIPACMIMAMTRSFIRSNVSRFTTMKDMLTELNDNLYHDMGDGRYITLGVCLLNRRQSTMEYARAGHTELLVYVRDHIRSIYPDGTGLGLLPGMLAEFDTLNIEFSPEMEVLLFTDGINEATNPAGEYFGLDRIKDILVKSGSDHDQPHDTIARIIGAVDDFSQQPNSQADDQTVVIIRHD